MIEFLRKNPDAPKKITKKEVEATLTLYIWKTRYAILQEIETTRLNNGKPSFPEATFWTNSAKMKIMKILLSMQQRQRVESKKEIDLTASERHFSVSNELDETTRQRSEHNNVFYFRTKMIPGGKPKKTGLMANQVPEVAVAH